MKSTRDVKLECLKAVAPLVTSKQVRPADFIPLAVECFRWVDGHDDVVAEADLVKLKERFRGVR